MDLDAQRGERIRSERDRLGLSQQKAADAAGVRREMWAKYEAGSEPGAKALSGMALAGADVLYILTGHRTPTAHPADALPEDERRLLNGYRLCGAEARQHLIQSAALLAAGLPSASPAAQGGMNMSNLGDGNVQIGSVGGSYSAVPPKPSPRKKTTK